jgi:hypothetical protein
VKHLRGAEAVEDLDAEMLGEAAADVGPLTCSSPTSPTATSAPSSPMIRSS